MQIKKTKKSNRNLILVAIATVIVLAGSAYLLALGANQSQKIPQSTQQEKETGDNIKDNSIKPVSKTDDSPSGNGSDPLPTPTPSQNSKPSVGMEITSTNQDNDTLSIRTLIKTIASTGLCKLTMIHESGATYSISAEVQPLASSTTCKGFDIPLSNLNSGIWKTTITYENDSVQSQTTKEIVVK